MMMTLRYIDTQEPWNPKQPINGVRHPRNIEQLWSAADLAAIGLETVPAAAPEPTPPRTTGDFAEFMGLFTQAEQAAIKTAALSVDAIAVGLWYDQAVAANSIDLTSVRVGQGMAALVAGGLLTQARSDEILASNFG